MPPTALTYCPMSLRCLTLGSGRGGVLAGMSGAQILNSSLFILNSRLTPPPESLRNHYTRASARYNEYGTFKSYKKGWNVPFCMYDFMYNPNNK